MSKKTDNRQFFLVVQGLDGGFVLSLNPDGQAAALSFATKVPLT